MENTVRMALIGFGGMGCTYARMIYAGMVPGMQLVGVCCRNVAGQAVLKEDFPGVAVYPDADSMAAAAEDYDAVLIVTPHTSHVPLGLQFAALGKHLLLVTKLYAILIYNVVLAVAQSANNQFFAKCSCQILLLFSDYFNQSL